MCLLENRAACLHVPLTWGYLVSLKAQPGLPLSLPLCPVQWQTCSWEVGITAPCSIACCHLLGAVEP